MALAVYVFDRTGSAGWVAAATVLRLVPYVVLAPIGGVVADRFDRRSVMIWSDVLRAISMAALAVTAAADGPVLLVTLLAFTTTAFGTAYVPAMMAITPALVGEDDLAAANALNTLVANLTIVIGPAVGAALLAVTSPVFAFTVNSLTFLAPAILVTFGLRTVHERTTDDGASSEPGAFVAHFLEGIREISRSAGARVLAAFLLAVAFIYGAQTVALVLVSDERLGTDARGYGYLLGALGAGGVIAAPLVNRLASGRRLAPTLLTGIGLAALPMAVLCLVHSPVVAAALMVVSGAGATAVDVLTVTLLQRALPDELRGRVFGLLDSGIVLAILAGSLIVSPLVSLLGLSGMLVALGLGVCALAVVGVHRTLLLDQAGATELDVLTPTVELLASLPDPRARDPASHRAAGPSGDHRGGGCGARGDRGGRPRRRLVRGVLGSPGRREGSARRRPADGRDRGPRRLLRRDRPHPVGAPHRDGVDRHLGAARAGARRGVPRRVVVVAGGVGSRARRGDDPPRATRPFVGLS